MSNSVFLRLITIFLLYSPHAQAQPNWLTDLVICYRKITNLNNWNYDYDTHDEVKKYDIIPGVYKGRAGVWLYYDDLAQFIILPGGRSDEKYYGVKVPLENGRDLYMALVPENPQEVRGSPGFQVRLSLTPISNVTLTTLDTTSRILDPEIRDSLIDYTLSKLNNVKREEVAELRRGIRVPKRAPLDGYVLDENAKKRKNLLMCRGLIANLQEQNKRLIDAIDQKLLKLSLPQIPTDIHGNRDTPTAL